MVFGGEHMKEWAVMNGSERTTFLNPLEALYDRIAAVKLLAGRGAGGRSDRVHEPLEVSRRDGRRV